MKPLANHLAQQMRQHPLVSFYLIAFGWTWLIEVVILSLWHPSSGTGGDAARAILVAVLGAPAFPALLMIVLTEGRAGVGQLWCRCLLWRVGVRWYLLVLIGFPVLILLGLLVPPGGIVGFREPVLTLIESYVPAFIVILLVGGPLAEEPAWRGFALPRLEHRLGPLGGTLLLGLLWGLWHFPLFFFTPGYNGASTGVIGIGLPFVEFVIGSVALSVIFTWIFHNTGGSLLLTMLLHASENTFVGTVFATQIGYLSLYLVYLVLAVLIIMVTRGHLSYEYYQHQMRCSVPSGDIATQKS